MFHKLFCQKRIRKQYFKIHCRIWKKLQNQREEFAHAIAALIFAKNMSNSLPSSPFNAAKKCIKLNKQKIALSSCYTLHKIIKHLINICKSKENPLVSH